MNARRRAYRRPECERFATVDRVLTGRDEGMGIEIEDYTA